MIRDVPLTITLSHISPVSKVIERLLSFVNSNTDPFTSGVEFVIREYIFKHQ